MRCGVILNDLLRHWTAPHKSWSPPAIPNCSFSALHGVYLGLQLEEVAGGLPPPKLDWRPAAAVKGHHPKPPK